MLAQTIIAMAHHGYLELEGGQEMISFIVRQCSLPHDPPVSNIEQHDTVQHNRPFIITAEMKLFLMLNTNSFHAVCCMLHVK